MKRSSDRSGATLVPMIDAEPVSRIRVLPQMRWGRERLAAELRIARNTVRR